MAWNLSQKSFTAPSAVDLSQSQFCFVSLNSSGDASYCGNTTIPRGILLNQPSTGTFATNSQYQPSICYAGVTRLAVGGAYPIGTYFVPGTLDGTYGYGFAVADASSTQACIRAWSTQASTAAYDIVTVQMIGPYPGNDTTTNP